MKKGLISVVIPVYNREAFLEECVQSVLAQTYKNFEIILADDGSTDRSLEICKELAEKDERIRVIEANHKGVSAARNLILDVVEGEYVFFLDSDDVIYPLIFEVFVKNMEKTGALIAGTEVVNCGTAHWEKIQSKLKNPVESGNVEFKDYEKTLEMVFNKRGAFSCIGGTMMKYELIGDTRFLEELFIGEDFYFIYQNLIKGADCLFLKEKWYFARWHETNTSWSYGYDGFWTRFHRRELVWKSEEAAGRIKYANHEKQKSFYCFTLCIQKNKPYSEDAKKMRATIKKYKKEIFPAMTKKQKLIYYFLCYFPAISKLILNVLSKQKK